MPPVLSMDSADSFNSKATIRSLFKSSFSISRRGSKSATHRQADQELLFGRSSTLPSGPPLLLFSSGWLRKTMNYLNKSHQLYHEITQYIKHSQLPQDPHDLIHLLQQQESILINLNPFKWNGSNPSDR
jgi:hypothetical protein